MREILFRGKDLVSREWITGFLVDKKHIGSWVEANPIYPETVGQYTGLTDKNGKKIFEGDIVQCYGLNCSGEEIVGHITFGDCCFCVKEKKSINQPAMDLCSDFEVIGNIHDNPELLED